MVAMKKQMIWKSTFREIKLSLGRFLAIFAIVTLGVGFLAGLKMAKPAMIETADAYLAEQDFYDYRLLSTLGLEEEEIVYLQSKEEVESAEGAVSFDVLYLNDSGNEGVIRAHSITDEVNRLLLTEGRMPENADECVVDSKMMGNLKIGDTLSLSDNNEEDDLEHFAYREYTIVGIVQSPLYIQYERGNSSLGTGKVAGFVYLPYDGFDVDYYTEAYVKFQEDFPLYGDAYDGYIEAKDSEWEQYLTEAADMRYQRVLTDAKEELADARSEYETEKADAEAELADAKNKLDDAAEKLSDGEQQLADAKQELIDARTTVTEKEQEIADAETELADGEKEIADAIQKWYDGKYELDQAKSAMREGKAQLDSQKSALLAQEQELMDERLAMEAMFSYEQLENDPILRDAYQQILGGLAAVALGKDQIVAAEKEMSAGQEKIKSGDKNLADAWAEIEKGQKEIEDGRAELEDGRSKLADARKDIEEGEKTLTEKEQELADAKIEYEDGLKEYEEGVLEFDEKIADAEAKLTDAEEEIEDIEEPDTYLLGRDTNIGYVCFDSDTSIVAGIANVFPIFFFLVAALVCVTTMSRMVEEQRTQIGTLKALGYSDGIIMTKYLFYAGSAGVLGCIIGFLAGTYLFPQVIWKAYGILYTMDELTYLFDIRLAVIALVITLLCTVGATWLSCRAELSETSAQLMRPKAPKAGKRVFLEKIPFIWKRMSFLHKVSIRNLFRYKRRLFMMVLGISGCMSLLVAAFGIEDSIAGIAKQQFEQIQVYDLEISFSETVSSEELKKIREVSGVTEENIFPVSAGVYDFVTDTERKPVNLVVAEKGREITPFVDLHTKSGEAVAFPGTGEIVISDKLARTYGLQVGDTITLQNEDLETVTAEISGIFQNFIYHYAYINSETYHNETGQSAEYQNVYVNLEKEADAHQVMAELIGMENVASVTVNADVMERINGMLGSLDMIVFVVICCAAGLAFIVLYNLTNINITERVREIATIKVLGFRKNETASYVFRENMLLSLMGIVVGLVLGHFLHRFIMHEIDIDLFAFDVHVRTVSYCYSALLTLLFTTLVNLFMKRKLERISMTESLKSVE